MNSAIGRSLVIMLKIDKNSTIYLSLAISLYIKDKRKPLLSVREVT